MRFPRLDLFTTTRNEDTGRYLMLEWGWYRFTARLFVREVIDWACWTAATKLPRKVALLAFVRVAAATGDAPDTITYDRAYKAWDTGAGR